MSAALDLLLPVAAPARESTGNRDARSKGPSDGSFPKLLDRSVREEPKPSGPARPPRKEAEADGEPIVVGDSSPATAQKAAAASDPARAEGPARGESRSGEPRAPSAPPGLEGSERAAGRLPSGPMAPESIATAAEPVAPGAASPPAANPGEIHDSRVRTSPSKESGLAGVPARTGDGGEAVGRGSEVGDRSGILAKLRVPEHPEARRAVPDRVTADRGSALRAAAASHVDDPTSGPHAPVPSPDAAPPAASALGSGSVSDGSPAPTPLVPNAGVEIVAARSAAAGSPPAEPIVNAPLEDVPVRVEWLAQRGGGVARLQLDPPQLGHVEMVVRLRGSDVEVVIAASEPLAQAAVQSQRAQLADGLATRELRLSQFDVSHSGGEDASGSRGSEGSASGEGDGKTAHGSRTATERSGSGDGPGPPMDPGLSPPAHAMDTRIDLHA